MANAFVQFRMDENLKEKASAICEEMGIDLPTYFRICAKKLVRDGAIPFNMKVQNVDPEFERMMESLHNDAIKSGAVNMTMEEIDEEIAKYRRGE